MNADERRWQTAIFSHLRLSAFICAAIFLAEARGAAPSKPNVVLIISDDHRWDAIGAAGNKSIHTPNLDKLAKTGTYYRQGTIHVPQCSPSRATLLTGLPPHASGWYSNQAQRPDVTSPDGFKQYPLLPALMRDAGYRTVLVGKWHVAPEPWNCGFEQVRTWMPGGSSPYQDPPKALAKGNSRDRQVIKGYTNEIFGTDAAEFIKSDSAKEKPFFLWVALTAPHTPLTPNPPDVQKLYEGKPADELWPPALPKDAKPRRLKDYCEAVSMADRQVGHVLDALDAQKLTENTLVIFIGDNGWMMGTRRLLDKDDYQGKVYPYEDSVRVPFIVRMPGKGSAVSESCASSLDLPPTILAAAGVTPPQTWSGRNLLAGGAETFDHAICEFVDPENSNEKFGRIDYRLVRTKTHKLIDWGEADRPDELYDLAADPAEKKNLIDDASAAKVRDDLRARLADWMKKTNDPNMKKG